MRKRGKPAVRLAKKSDAHTLARNLITRYNMSVAEAECLTRELRDKQREEDPLVLLDGQSFYTAVDSEEASGKPLERCATRRVRLTLHDTQDPAYRAQNGLRALRKLLVSRLCFEAFRQGALLAQEDLCALLYLSRASVQRLLAEYRQEKEYIPTRGNYHDIGPARSHKYQAVRLYLQGYQPTEVAMRLCHNLSSVERYLDAFCRVMAALEEGFTVPAIARFTGHSQRLVREYQALYEEFKDHPSHQEPLDALRRRIHGLQGAGKRGPR